MATRQDFTDDEWAHLQKGVTGSAMLVSLSDRDFTDTFGEVGAMTKTWRASRPRPPAGSSAAGEDAQHRVRADDVARPDARRHDGGDPRLDRAAPGQGA